MGGTGEYPIMACFNMEGQRDFIVHMICIRGFWITKIHFLKGYRKTFRHVFPTFHDSIKIIKDQTNNTKKRLNLKKTEYKR